MQLHTLTEPVHSQDWPRAELEEETMEWLQLGLSTTLSVLFYFILI